MPEEKNEINKFASWNGFQKSILTSIIKRALNKSFNDNHIDGDNDIKFYLNLPYFGKAREVLVKKCIRSLKKNLKKDMSCIGSNQINFLQQHKRLYW